jgi:hypothetical protein
LQVAPRGRLGEPCRQVRLSPGRLPIGNLPCRTARWRKWAKCKPPCRWLLTGLIKWQYLSPQKGYSNSAGSFGLPVKMLHTRGEGESGFSRLMRAIGMFHENAGKWMPAIIPFANKMWLKCQQASVYAGLFHEGTRRRTIIRALW